MQAPEKQPGLRCSQPAFGGTQPRDGVALSSAKETN
ncbi:rCG62467 [Rattus norvegicus]|uniref:RCG62467 n=1 Tax=Rattus norvegicus TaxID=10116 RepID=A6J5Y9_RAT|nr:rCG62467 [Rattus norvegicus]